jgi:hypothetical protein
MKEDLTILGDDKHQREDLRLVLMAVRRRWPIPEDRKASIVTRMLEIVGKREVDLHFESGPRPSEERADTNAIKAAAILAALEGQNQSDEHAEAKNARLDAGKATDRTEVVEVELKFDNAG